MDTHPPEQAPATAGALSRDAEGELVLHPKPSATRPRVVGPGRRERAYLERLEAREAELLRARAELELAALVERGAGRRIERLERAAARERAELERVRQEENRLLVLIGRLQSENEHLHAALRLAEGRLAQLGGPVRAGFWQRIQRAFAPGGRRPGKSRT